MTKKELEKENQKLNDEIAYLKEIISNLSKSHNNMCITIEKEKSGDPYQQYLPYPYAYPPIVIRDPLPWEYPFTCTTEITCTGQILS